MRHPILATFKAEDGYSIKVYREGHLVAELLAVSIQGNRGPAGIFARGITPLRSQPHLVGSLIVSGGQPFEMAIAPWDLRIRGRYNLVIQGCELLNEKSPAEFLKAPPEAQFVWLGPKKYPETLEQLLRAVSKEQDE